MNPANFYEAYVAVYDEDLKEELLVIEEDFEFIDELSDNELDQVMEEILLEGLELSECFEAFDEVLSEARVDMAARAAARKKYSQESEKAAKEARGRAEAKQKSERRAERVERMKSSAKRAAEKVKTTASKASKKVGGKLSAAKEKISGFVKKVGKAAKSGYSAAKKEFSGEAEREARARSTGREMKRAARRQTSAARSKDTSEFEKPKGSTYRNVGAGRKEKAGGEIKATHKTAKPNQERIAAARAKLAKAAAGSSSRGIRFATSSGQVASTRTNTGKKEALDKFRKKVGLSDHYEYLLNVIFEDMINEGYVSDNETALYVIESLSESDLDYVLDSYDLYLTEDVEFDNFDYILEYLITEGYADTNETAINIMANMSEEWRNDIMEISAGRIEQMKKERVRRSNKALGRAAGLFGGNDSSKLNAYGKAMNKEGGLNRLITSRNKRTGSNIETTDIRRHQ